MLNLFSLGITFSLWDFCPHCIVRCKNIIAFMRELVGGGEWWGRRGLLLSSVELEVWPSWKITGELSLQDFQKTRLRSQKHHFWWAGIKWSGRVYGNGNQGSIHLKNYLKWAAKHRASNPNQPACPDAWEVKFLRLSRVLSEKVLGLIYIETSKGPDCIPGFNKSDIQFHSA